MIKIEENYKKFVPHPKIKKSVERMVAALPPDRLVGLRTIILSNTKALNNKKRRQKTKSRKKKVALNQCQGWYIQKWKNNPAYIELLIDNIFSDFPKRLYFFDFLIDFTIGETLFHEIGHHIHKTQSPEFKDKEDVAEEWKRKLSRCYYPRRYWYLIYPSKPFFIIYKLFKKK